MAVSIMTNVVSLSAQRNLAKAQALQASSVGRLSSGLRINKAADDAAGLAISNRMSAQLKGMSVAQRNTNDAVSVVQTAEGALAEIDGMLSRMRELAVQASNGGTLTTADRANLDDEFQALESEINRISDSTQYNGQTLVDGSLSGGVTFQVGVFNTANDRITTSEFTNIDASSLGLDVTLLTTVTNAQSAIAQIDTAINSVSSKRGKYGALQNRLTVTASNLSSMQENAAAAQSRIADVDVASESAALTRAQILSQAAVSVLAQANQLPAIALSLLGG